MVEKVHMWLRFYVQDPLTSETTVNQLQRVLNETLPYWTTALHVMQSERGESTRALMAERGLFQAMELVSPQKWGLTSAILKGTYEGLTVFIEGARSTLPPESNMITVEIADLTQVEDKAPWVWAVSFAERLTTKIETRYGYSCLSEEFDSKNILHDESGVRAVGVNLKHSLPGIYWMNFFGPPYLELMGGAERLLNTPAFRTISCGGGVLIVLAETPLEWRSLSYKAKETAAVRHLGAQYFFSPSDPERKTRAPDFFTSRRET